jgi:hypothetical protein
MADNVPITAGSGTNIATDDISGVHYQRIKLVDGTLDSTDAIGGDATNGLDVDVTRLPALVAGSANIGDVDVLTVPADPFGANADAASASGSISAKLRFIAATGISVTSIAAGDNNIGNVDVLTTVEPVVLNGSGSLTAAEQAVTLTLAGRANATFQLTGTWTATVTFEASNDNTNWTTIFGLRAGDNTISTTVVNSTNNDIYRCTVAGFVYARLRCSAYTSGTIVVTALATGSTSGVFLNFALPPGTNNIGDVDVLTVPADPFGANADAASATGSISAKLRFLAATGIAGMTALPAGTNNIGDVDVLTVPADPFGANADAASATGSISAKLRFIAATGIPVTSLPALAAGSNLIGAVNPQGYFATCSTDVTRPADTNAYAVNDALSDSTTTPTTGGFTFTGAARNSGGSGIITDAIIATSNDAATQLQGEIMIFNQAVTAINDNAAWAITDAEAKTLIGKIPFTLEDIGNNGWCHVQNLNIGFTCSGSANLRFLVRVKNAYTPASAEVLTFIIKCLQVT